MEIILTQDMDKLGKMGSVLKVKEGFARNFLLPRNLAIPATPVNLKKIEQATQRIASLKQRKKEEVLNLSNRLNGISITIPVAAHDEDKLYGSVSSSDIIEALKQEGISNIAEEAVILAEPIKSIGVYEVGIKLHAEVSAKIKVWIVKK